MTVNTYELFSMPTELLMENLDALIQIVVIVEASALVLIVIIFAILAWSVPSEIKQSDCNQELR